MPECTALSWGVPTVAVSTEHASYNVHVGSGLLASLRRRIQALPTAQGRPQFVVTSPEIWRLWSPALLSSFRGHPTPEPLFLPVGESHKRLRSVEQLAEALSRARADRDTLLLALGGGIVGDVTGFLAAIYMRGIPFVQIPTTLLAQVDSSVGGKTGVNLRTGKNLLGSFHHPLAVFADTDTLGTLPARELRAGLQEAVKAGVICSPSLFRLLERQAPVLLDPAHPDHSRALSQVITASVRIKAEVVHADEREAGLRMILNFGHTLGHAIEAATGYKQLLHGEAIGWGMIAATRLALSRGTIASGPAERIEQLILRYGPLPRFRASAERLVALTAGDKKSRSGVLSFILPAAVGTVARVRDVTQPELLAAAKSVLTLAAHQPDPSNV